MIGLLAYGSLRWDPGRDLLEAVDLDAAVDGIETPFPIEFARRSTTRDGCPTLIPVETGGARVAALLIPFRGGVSAGEAQTLIWRREVGQPDGQYDPESNPGPNKVLVERVKQGYEGFEVVLSVRIGANIENLSGDVLAELAIRSARAKAGVRRKDGITYLIKAKESGIETPLRSAYEAAILRQLGVASLEEAWRAARSH